MATETNVRESTPRCITIIGMAGAGKTTLGAELARQLGWAHMDTDALIEAIYGVPLQTVADTLSKEAFLDMEAAAILNIRVGETVLSTGGSAVYRAEAMDHLKQLGPVIHLHVSLPLILERIARNPDRGIAIAPGQTIEDLFLERERLYEHYADFTLHADQLAPAACAVAVAEWLERAEMLG